MNPKVLTALAILIGFGVAASIATGAMGHGNLNDVALYWVIGAFAAGFVVLKFN